MNSTHREIFAVLKVGEKDIWQRIGTAFRNADGSENLVFNLLPVKEGTTIQIRDPRPKQTEETAAAAPAAAG